MRNQTGKQRPFFLGPHIHNLLSNYADHNFNLPAVEPDYQEPSCTRTVPRKNSAEDLQIRTASGPFSRWYGSPSYWIGASSQKGALSCCFDPAHSFQHSARGKICG